MVIRYAPQPCPHCGATLDASTGFEDDIEPRSGDVSVCAACHGFLVWDRPSVKEGEPDPDLAQRKLTPREFTQLPGSVRADLLRAQAQLEEIERSQRLAKH
jgi:hypothetical protein